MKNFYLYIALLCSLALNASLLRMLSETVTPEMAQAIQEKEKKIVRLDNEQDTCSDLDLDNKRLPAKKIIGAGAQDLIISWHHDERGCVMTEHLPKKSGRLLPYKRTEVSGHTDNVLDIAITPHRDLMASASSDGSIMLWNLNNRSYVNRLENHTDWVTCVAFNAQGNLLVSGQRNGRIQVRDLKEKTHLITDTTRGSWITACAVSPQDNRFIAASVDGSITIFEGTGHIVSSFKGHDDCIGSVAFDAKGERILSSCVDGTITIWDPATHSRIHEYIPCAGINCGFCNLR